jgi:hypothetical protein
MKNSTADYVDLPFPAKMEIVGIPSTPFDWWFGHLGETIVVVSYRENWDDFILDNGDAIDRNQVKVLTK